MSRLLIQSRFLKPMYWLLKAEPDSRIVKGKDVKFSVDDFESVKTSPWEGVRNYEARNLMKEMQVGEKALFYHSNCKIPGIAGFAEVAKEAYPDYTAWDASHPYYDAKTKQEDPRWFMVDMTFVSRAAHFVPLALLRLVAESAMLPPEIAYIEETGFKALRAMDLVKKGRLSVQRVDENAWSAIVALAEKGGWDDMELKGMKKDKGATKAIAPKPRKKSSGRRRKGNMSEADDEKSDEPVVEDESREDEDNASSTELPQKRGRKRKATVDDDDTYPARPNRPTRRRKQ